MAQHVRARPRMRSDRPGAADGAHGRRGHEEDVAEGAPTRQPGDEVREVEHDNATQHEGGERCPSQRVADASR